MKAVHQLNPDKWIHEYRDYLVNYARQKVSDHGIAEDLAQETFLSAWSARLRFRGHCTEKTWLVGILRNKIIDHYRRTARRPMLNETDLQLPAWDDDGKVGNWLEQHAIAGDRFDPVKNTERFEFMKQLDAGIERLPDLSGQAFRMREIQGLSTDEITSALNITKSNLWVLIHRAKSGLQQHFSGSWYPDNVKAAA